MTIRLAWILILTGAILIPLTAVQRELTRNQGVLTGQGLFRVRASDEMTVEWLSEAEEVAAGEPLARLMSENHSTRTKEIQARLAHAEAEREVLTLLPMARDPELTRRHQEVIQERTLAQQELGQLIIAAEASNRDLIAQLNAKRETFSRLDLTLTERRKELLRATIQSNHARELLESFSNLSVGSSVSSKEYQEYLRAARDGEINVTSLNLEIKNLLTEKEVIRVQLEKLEVDISNQASPLRTQIQSLNTRLSQLKTEEALLQAKFEEDMARSVKLRDAEKTRIAAKIQEQRSLLVSVGREQEILAPFAGRLAYRASSPNATRSQGTLAVLAPSGGFVLTARMDQSDVQAMRASAAATIELTDDTMERRIPARFRHTEPLPQEPEYSTVLLDCQPPPEIVRRLAEGEKITVTFGWQPPLNVLWPFRLGVLLAAIGCIILMLRKVNQVTSRGLQTYEPTVVAHSDVPCTLMRLPVQVRMGEEVVDVTNMYIDVHPSSPSSHAQDPLVRDPLAPSSHLQKPFSPTPHAPASHLQKPYSPDAPPFRDGPTGFEAALRYTKRLPWLFMSWLARIVKSRARTSARSEKLQRLRQVVQILKPPAYNAPKQLESSKA